MRKVLFEEQKQFHRAIGSVQKALQKSAISQESFYDPIAGVFYNVKNRLSFIASKSLSKNLSNENKQLCFCCLQDKT